MKCYALINAGLEELAQQELKELIGIKATIFPGFLEFSLKNKEDLVTLLLYAQAPRRILLSLTKDNISGELDQLDFVTYLTELFPPKFSLKIEVENLKGQDNRTAVAKKIGSALFSACNKVGITPTIKFKDSDFITVVYFTGKEYLLGIDLYGSELNVRDYRLFPHPASLKGDLSYYFLRTSKFVKEDKLLLGFVKDGSIAIEAALFSNKVPVREITSASSLRLPFFKDFDITNFLKKNSNNNTSSKDNKNITTETKKIIAFDEPTQNVTAARKNVVLANVKDYVTISKLSLDELDVRFEKKWFNLAIFQITKKDEDKINEIYYQLSYVLKTGGTLLLIGRNNWDLSISDKFNLIYKKEIFKGQSSYGLWLLEKK